MIDIRMALTQALLQLDSFNPDSRLEAEILLAHVLQKNRSYLFAHHDERINDVQYSNYVQLIQQRSQGVPIAYIIGTRDFWSLSYKVNSHTLIPRHETERLVELALELIPDKPGIQVLDLGTGSGAIALSLATERPQWNITASDFSKEALEIAKENAHNFKLTNVSFYHSKWFETLPEIQYQAILSNPPYIAEQDPHLTQGDLRFEPLNALASSQEGLADLQYIIRNSYNYLLPKGLLLIEHGYDQKNSVHTMLEQAGYREIQCWQDIHGHDRVSGGWRTS